MAFAHIQKLIFIFLLLLYRVGLDISYHFIIGDLYAHVYKINSCYPIRLMESYVLTLAVIPFLRSKFRRPSDLYTFLLVILVLMPMFTIFCFTGGNRLYMYVVFVAVITLISVTRIPQLRVASLKEGPAIAIVLCLVGVVGTLAWLFSKGAGNSFNLDVTDVYATRSVVTETAFIGLWGYVIFWSAKVLNPAVLAFSLYKRRWSSAVLLFFVQIMFFGLTGHKFILAIGLGVLILYILLQRRWPAHLILIGMLGSMCVAAAAFVICGDVWLPALFVQRPLFKPALLNFTYFEYFQPRELVLLSSGILGNVISYPFDAPAPFLVGEYLKGNPPPRSNTGFLGTGYMHFGLIGPILFAVVVGIIFRIIDSLAENRLPLWFTCAIVFGPMTSMITSGDLLPSLNTHGGLLSFLLLWLFRRSYCLEWEKGWRPARPRSNGCNSLRVINKILGYAKVPFKKNAKVS